MKVSTEKIPESQVVMTIEVEPERLEAARGKALRKLAPRAKVPGFRPGKAPEPMLRRYLGEERILDEALDDLVPVLYREAVEADESIDPIARPRLVVETTEPLVVKATIPVRPTVDLGDYQAVRIPTEEISVDDERVDATIETLRHRAATLEPVEREIAWNDVLTIDVKGHVEEEELADQQDIQVQLIEERDILFPGFEEAMLGHKKGDTVEFDLPVPEDVTSEKFKGKTAHFSVPVKEIKEEVLPELDEEFTKQVGDGYETVEALRDRIRDDIRGAEEEQRANRYHDEIMTKLAETATVDYPPVMLDAEIDRMLHEQAGHIEEGRGLEQYLAALGKTEEEVRADFRPVADTRLRRSLILTEVSDVEKIEVTDEDIEAELDRLSASAGAQAAQFRQLFDRQEGRDTIRRNLLTRKTLDRLVAIATQDGGAAPEEPKPAEEAKPADEVAKPATAKKPRSRAKAKAEPAPEATTQDAAPAAETTEETS
ncbi:MAG TPA: trigger factor [Dehalococcoidia bacterium]|nr:trigger factor [Dehalococcoidia bacterium]